MAIVPNIGLFHSWGLTGTLATSAEIAQLSKRCHLVLVANGTHENNGTKVGWVYQTFMVIQYIDSIWCDGKLGNIFMGWRFLYGKNSREYDFFVVDRHGYTVMPKMSWIDTLSVAGWCCTLIHGPELWPLLQQILRPWCDWLVLMCGKLSWQVVVFRRKDCMLFDFTIFSGCQGG